MIYTVDDYNGQSRNFGLSYSQLKIGYEDLCNLSNEDFIRDVQHALHFAAIISYLKEIPTSVCLSDVGLIHELIHLVCGTEPSTDLETIRLMFKEQLKLS